MEAFPDKGDAAICGNVWETFGKDPIEFDNIRNIDLIMYGIPGFDNVFQGFLTIFQILTLESWVYLMYNYSDAGDAAISVIFFVLVVLLGAFFTMNLVLAIIVDAFNSASEAAAQRVADEEEEEKLQESEEKESEGPEKPKALEENKVAPAAENINEDLSEVDGKDLKSIE